MSLLTALLVDTQDALFDAHVQVALDCNTALLEEKDFLMGKIDNLQQEVKLSYKIL